MNLRSCVLCTAALLAFGLFALPTSGLPFLEDSNITATIHGATYAWDTLEPLNDTVININSNPPQSIVAKNGMYSFDLGPGDYVITARYYKNNTVIYSKQTTLKIEDEGNYVFDLLLYPVSENSAKGAAEEKIDYTNTSSSAGKARYDSSTEADFSSRNDSSIISNLPVALIFIFLLGGGYKLSRNRKNLKTKTVQAKKLDTSGLLEKTLRKRGVKPEFGDLGEAVSTKGQVREPVMESADYSEIEPVDLKKSPLSTDLREVLDVIRGHRGRITQKDLRSRLNYSEVKVSLLLSELEKRGLIKKLKHGRENIVILIDEKQR